MTGGCLKRVRGSLGEGSFCFTYGDGVRDVDVTALIAHHKKHVRLATATAVEDPQRSLGRYSSAVVMPMKACRKSSRVMAPGSMAVTLCWSRR
jgi:glucose-1-phosphate cytidylyltransferase